ncbi:MAG TPA: DUF4097 family beta strand repeat-containing protein [Pyrinomonadaceae bacterium]|nr:DUF4097 family beta strand repeat-containing protein [Pyrinomonadaceae bacterium]
MKRIVIAILLVVVAGIAGMVVRSSSRGEFRELAASHSAQDVSDVIRQSFELSPGTQVELIGLNGSVTVETSDSQTANVVVERTASSQDALDRRRVVIESSSGSLRIRGEKSNTGFFSRFFGGSEARERVTLKLPREVSLFAKGINGAVTVGELKGKVEMAGINGRIQIARASGAASFKGINGNIVIALSRLDQEGITLSGVNGNIDLELPADANADLEAHGMNGRVVSELPNVTVDQSKHGNYSARIGSGGSAIDAKGINGNIRLSRSGDSRPADAGN